MFTQVPALNKSYIIFFYYTGAEVRPRRSVAAGKEGATMITTSGTHAGNRLIENGLFEYLRGFSAVSEDFRSRMRISRYPPEMKGSL
ncbi:UNVERIFIED_CONTAM: hypothetical protein PYX00_001641 [Menopon gallinae]|uniref:Uncharacterized protein n=1 Tax=Menopon gallinae TaxID=328185 RepID=A0AAW2IE64_9NEOP